MKQQEVTQSSGSVGLADAPCCSEQNHQMVSRLVDAFSRNAIEDIMVCFAEDAVYYDVRGGPPSGSTYRGKASIRKAFTEHFRLLGKHTYEDPEIMADDRSGFARWTLVLGDVEDKGAARFDGIDHFIFNEDGLCISKTAWLKGQQYLARHLFMRRPLATLRAQIWG